MVLHQRPQTAWSHQMEHESHSSVRRQVLLLVSVWSSVLVSVCTFVSLLLPVLKIRLPGVSYVTSCFWPLFLSVVICPALTDPSKCPFVSSVPLNVCRLWPRVMWLRQQLYAVCCLSQVKVSSFMLQSFAYFCVCRWSHELIFGKRTFLGFFLLHTLTSCLNVVGHSDLFYSEVPLCMCTHGCVVISAVLGLCAGFRRMWTG